VLEVWPRLFGVTVIFDGVQLHGTVRACGLAAPEAVKVKVPFLQAMPEILTDCGTPGDRVLPGGVKVVVPTLLLAAQVILPEELAASVRVTVHGAVTPQVLESKLTGLTDHIGTVGEGDGDGEGEGVGVGVGVVPGDLVGEGVGLGVGTGVTPVTTSVTATVAFPAFEVILTVPE
jgi:hypothetical protein